MEKDKPLTVEDLQDASGPVGEEDDSAGTSAPDQQGSHPYGDNTYGKGSSHVLKQLGAGKPIRPGKGQ